MTCLKTATKEYKQARKNFITSLFHAFPQITKLELNNYFGRTSISDINQSGFPSDYDNISELRQDLKDKGDHVRGWLVENNLTILDVISLAQALYTFPLERTDDDITLVRSSYIKEPRKINASRVKK